MSANAFGGAVQGGGGFFEEALAGWIFVRPKVNPAASEQRNPCGIEAIAS
jgi:hypothetical protein